MTPLVLVHGFMGGRSQWQLQRAAFEDRFFVVPVALPGFGDNSEASALSSISGFADQILRDLSAAGIQRCHLIGHSMGGMIAQQMVHQAPDRIDHLILYGTGPIGMLPGRFEPIAESKRRAIHEGLAPTARRIAATWFLDGASSAAYENCAALAAQTAAAAFEGGLDAMATWSGVAWLPDIGSPTLVLWGDGDRTYPWAQPEMLWRQIPQARLAVIPGCAHAVHLEKPALFNQVVLDFLPSP